MATYSSKPIPCTVQISGASAVPTNSTTVQWYVVSTSGVNASIGQIYYDDGSNSGNCTLFSAASYGTIFTPSALSGGTVTFSAGTYYYWTGSAWTAQTVTVAGAVYQTTVTIGTSATYSSTAQIAANAIINRVHTKVTTGYSGGATISVGITGTATLFAGTADSVATTIDEYSKLQHTSVGGSAATALVTIGGSPSVGAGTVDICWSVPLT
jgi:hypothetical protein